MCSTRTTARRRTARTRSRCLPTGIAGCVWAPSTTRSTGRRSSTPAADMAEPFTIRAVAEADAPALLAIYRPFVEDAAVSFETVTPGVDEFGARIAKAVAGWQWLVAERDGQCIGYAY